MKTCSGRVAKGATKVPIAKITAYSINKTHNSEEKQYLDDDCKTRKERVSTAIQLTIDGELDATDASHEEMEDMIGGEIHIFPVNEVSGAPWRKYDDVDTDTFNITGNAGGSVTFQATVTANGGRDMTSVTVP